MSRQVNSLSSSSAAASAHGRSVTTLALMLQCCILRLWLNSASYIGQKLLLTAYRKSHYEKSIGTKMNDLDLCIV